MAQASQGSVEDKRRRRRRRNSGFSSDSIRKIQARNDEREHALRPRCVPWLKEPEQEESKRRALFVRHLLACLFVLLE